MKIQQFNIDDFNFFINFEKSYMSKMDIIGRIKQELNYDVFDSHSINYIYKAHLEKKEKYKCLTIERIM